MRKTKQAVAIALTASLLLTGCGLTDAMAEIISDKLQKSSGTEETVEPVKPAEEAQTETETPEVVKPEEPETEAAEEPEPQADEAAPGVSPELVVLKKYDYAVSDDDLYITLVNGRVEAPALTDESAEQYPELAKSLKELDDDIFEEFDKTMGSLKEETGKEYELQTDHEYWVPYEDNERVSVRRADSKVVSLFFPFDAYSGGAHGIYGNACATFDTVTGEKIMLSDVLKSTDDLNSIIKESIEEQYADDLDMFYDLDESLSFYSADADPAEFNPDGPIGFTWAFSGEGVEIYFGPYSLASYAMGEQTVLIRYDEHPDLIDEKYMPEALNEGFIDHFGKYCYRYDVDNDGEIDAIGIDPIMNSDNSEYVNAKIYVNDQEAMVGEGDYDLPFPEEAEGYYVHTDDGRNYLYLVCATYSDFYDIYVFDLNSGKPVKSGYECCPSFYIDYDQKTDIARHFFLYDPDNMKIADRFDVITTFSAFKSYHIGPNGMPETDDEEYTIYNTGGWEPVKCIQSFEATYVNDDGEEEPYTINRGESFTFTATDGKTYLDTVISDGTPIRLYFEGHGNDLTINGYPAEDIFKELMYSG
ncbi:MAG: DUF3298 and DUF4163 domain-containing protein [Lachnospiraceae bacterium]|nr:DUF3298 and DUF4163 domain-containing protein [Lachnospiraceae bacterium]